EYPREWSHSRRVTQPASNSRVSNCLPTNPRWLLGQGCPSAWDSFTCWPPTEAGRALRKPCAHIIASLDISLAESDASLAQGLYAYRVCGADGKWLWGNWTNYTECLGLINQQSSSAVSLAVVYILLLFSLLSLIFLSASMFIFCYFRSLECPRTRVHRNLMLALAVHAVMLVVLSTPLALHPDAPTPFVQTPVLCKCVLSLKMYAATASINWMFVEGLLLHSRVAVSVFRQDAPFRLYYALGWGLPLAFILAWAYLTENELRTACWEGYGSSSYVWILIAPRLVAILVNSVFLVNIVRILVTRIKPKASALETTQFRKAIKATALLFPLLGITHLLFCINPQNETMGLKEAYMIINAVLQSSQGIFVSVLYCFMDSEVQTALRNAYLRAAVRRDPRKVSRSSRSWILPGGRQSRLGRSTVSSLSSVSRKLPPAASQPASNYRDSRRDNGRDGTCCNAAGLPCHCRSALQLSDPGRSRDRTVDNFHV
ncbi:corticotropin-releasing factor receptor 1, partial [Dermacentor silvarum]|uniref:corticotropin-releasing factor receptor 1 n=1 Tax=Dermacentor silvarum TaxID=543639 RepID=UPI002100F234